MTTEPLPRSVPDSPPKRRRRKAPWVIGGLVALIVLLVAAYAVAEVLIRDWATERVKTQVAQGLNVESTSDVGVQFSGSMVLQAILGRLDRADVTVDGATFGPLTGDLVIQAQGIPVDTSQPVEQLNVEMTVSEDNVRDLADYISGVRLADISLEEPEIVVETEFTVFVATVPVKLAVEPAAVDGALAFTPASVEVAGRRITADDLRESEFGALAGPLLEQREVCIAEYLPEPLVLQDVDIVGDELVAEFTGRSVVLSEAELTTMGTCP